MTRRSGLRGRCVAALSTPREKSPRKRHDDSMVQRVDGYKYAERRSGARALKAPPLATTLAIPFNYIHTTTAELTTRKS